jgi:hypothetical protein
MEAGACSFYRVETRPRRSGAVDHGDDATGGERAREWLRPVGDVEAVLARVRVQPMEDGGGRHRRAAVWYCGGGHRRGRRLQGTGEPMSVPLRLLRSW